MSAETNRDQESRPATPTGTPAVRLSAAERRVVEEGRAARRPWWKLDPKNPPLFFWWFCGGW